MTSRTNQLNSLNADSPHTDSPLAGIKRLNYLVNEMDGVYHEIALKFGLSDSCFQILYALCNQGGSCPLHTLCNLYGTSKQTINSALRKLEKENTIYLEQADGRKKRVCLTPQGMEKAQNTVARLIEEENNILKSWTEEEQELYLSLTQKYLISLKSITRHL